MIPKGTKGKGFFICDCGKKFSKTHKGNKKFQTHHENCKAVSNKRNRVMMENFERALERSEGR